MKKTVIPAILLVMVLAGGSKAGLEKPLPLIPAPVKVEFKSGNFVLGEPVSIAVFPADSPELQGIAGIFADKLKSNAGVSLKTSSAPGGKSVRLAMVKDAELARFGEEAYRLEVTPETIEVFANSGRGVFNGAMTALQLLSTAGKNGAPCLSMVDYPRFPHRGILIDPARNFLSVQMVKSVIDKISQLKFNTLHFHLVDDQGWRFESKLFPRLHEVGGQGKYYTQDQLREIVAYARARYVTVMPEIEMPGHSRAMLASYPELTCSGQRPEVAQGPGIYSTAICPGKPEVYEFLDKLLKEVAGIFPSYYIHTGSDEVAARDWRDYAPNQELEKTLSEKGNKGLQCYFINKVNQTFLDMDRRMTVWDEMVDCLPEGARVQAWRSIGAARTAAEADHEVVVSLVEPWYLDYPDWPWKLRRVYGFDPVPKDLAPGREKLIMGGEGNLWGERAPEETIMPKLFPRVMAISEVLWSPKDARDWDSFKCRLKSVRKAFEKQGVKFYIWLNLPPV